MPVPRSLSGLVTAGGKLYSVGGTLEMVTATRQLTCYDVEANHWTELTPMNDTRFDAGMVLHSSGLTSPFSWENKKQNLRECLQSWKIGSYHQNLINIFNY
jgi:hypothetical protein